jgi:calpain-7
LREVGLNLCRASDAVTYSLSHRQLQNLAGWKRPSELFKTRHEPVTLISDQDLMFAKVDSDLVQDITTDCSVVASLCAAMKQMKPGRRSVRVSCRPFHENTTLTGYQILSSLMFPFDHENGHPMVSPNGKYIFRMYFNGCPRQVIVDDRLPASKTDRALFVFDRQNPKLIWPALMEKAYLKVRGGYDFPGSNSGTDLWVLTGWIPEQIFMQR